jgi:hypothetical protein
MVMIDIPEKYREKCVKAKMVIYRSKKLVFMLTDNLNGYELIEFEDKSINNYVNLSDYQMIASGCFDADLDVFERSDNVLICLIKIEKFLFVFVRRRSSQLSFVKFYNNLQSFAVKAQNVNKNSDACVKIVHNFIEETSFYDYEINSVLSSEKNDSEKYKTLNDTLRSKKDCMLRNLSRERKMQKVKLYNLVATQKFVPPEMRTLNVSQQFNLKLKFNNLKELIFFKEPCDISPLARFGSMFSRVCNQTKKAIIGIPLQNVSSLER